MAKKKNMKYTEEEMQAMKVMAMLQGVDPSTIQNEEVEDIEIEIEDEKPKKRKAKAKEVTVGSENQVFTTKQRFIEDREEFAKLKKQIDMHINFNEHDIHYKEQYWGIPERTVLYHLELVKLPKVAQDISNLMNDNSLEEREKADKGLVRYYKVVTYENVVSKIREIGYVKVENKNGRMSCTIKVLGTTLKQCNANPDRVKKTISRVVKDNIANL